jgi:hypothetical protein
MTGDLFITSDRSWADRFSQLLKELQAVKAPDLCASSQIADSIAEKPEVQTSNFLPFERMPEGLHCFRQTRRLTEKENADLLRHWVLWRVDPKTVLSFSAPPAGSWNDAFKEQDAWAIFERVKRAPATNIVSSFLHLAINHRIRQDLINQFGLERADSILDLFHKRKPEPGLRPAQTLIKATLTRKGNFNLVAFRRIWRSLIKPHP